MSETSSKRAVEARCHSSRVHAGSIAIIATWLLCAPHPALALTSGETQCRSHIGKGVSKLMNAVLKEREKCHQLRMLGLLSSTTDCNDPAQSPVSQKVVKAAAALSGLTQARCEGMPQDLGYTACPVPCASHAITDYASLATCMTCITEGWVGDAVALGYGTPPVPTNPDAASCQAFVGLALRKYVMARARDQQKCQLAQDRKPTGADCVTADLKGNVAKARAKAQGTLARCTGGALASLDSCGATVAAEQSCIESVVNWCSDSLFYAIYRPAAPTPTPVGTAIYTRTSTFTLTPTPTQTPSATETLVPTVSPTATNSATPTNTTAFPPVHVDVTPFPAQSQSPCLIFVHGKRTNTGTYTDWNQARDYWKNGSDDFVRTATKNFATSYYVVGYNGSQAYWDTQSAGEVATEIVNASNGGADGGGNHCAQTYAQGGTFWVVAHSMGPSVMDYILGNASPSDPNYNRNGPYDIAAQRLSLVVSVAGAHRGSQGADLVCGGGNPVCSFFAQFIQDCDDATFWLQSSDAVQVRNFASPPAKTVWLTGGYKAIIGASLCLSGEDDGVVQNASTFACDGSATAEYSNSNYCDNSHKQEVSGFKNLDVGHENHDEERNDSSSDDRVAIPNGVWICNGSACGPGTTVQGSMSTATFVSRLY